MKTEDYFDYPSFIAYTDYPIIELGDLPGKPAPVREITVLGYDQDRYCTISVGGVIDSIKSGYIYTLPLKYKEAYDSNSVITHSYLVGFFFND